LKSCLAALFSPLISTATVTYLQYCAFVAGLNDANVNTQEYLVFRIAR